MVRIAHRRYCSYDQGQRLRNTGRQTTEGKAQEKQLYERSTRRCDVTEPGLKLSEV